MQALRSPYDLHVLGTPPAFVLSQDQTLRRRKLEQLIGTPMEPSVVRNLRWNPPVLTDRTQEDVAPPAQGPLTFP